MMTIDEALAKADAGMLAGRAAVERKLVSDLLVDGIDVDAIDDIVIASRERFAEEWRAERERLKAALLAELHDRASEG